MDNFPEIVAIRRRRDAAGVVRYQIKSGQIIFLTPEQHDRPELAQHLTATFWHVLGEPERHGAFGPDYESADFDDDEYDDAGVANDVRLGPEDTERFWIAWHAIAGGDDDIAAQLRMETALRLRDNDIIAKSGAAGVR